MLEVTHRISIADAHGHLFGITTTLAARGGKGRLPSPLRVFMPVWTPGSYLVREYARHVEGFSATADGKPAIHRKVRKNCWEIEHDGASSIDLSYRLYANDLSVRTNHLDATHAYWNGAATYLASEDLPDAGARVIVEMPAEWDIATALERDTAAPPNVRAFLAKTFDELCDAPFECGKLTVHSFATLRKQHALAAWDNADSREVDWEKLKVDTQTIVETEAALIAGDRSAEDALPYSRYLFLWHITPRGRGGLEHNDCATLMAKLSSFQTRAGYLDVLSLVAHELFHLWNVKRLRPAGLSPYRYEQENHTRLLWWFEGATSYYDWRTLRLAKLCTAAEYLNHLAEEIARLEDTPGAEVHSLEESSFDAWIKAYRPDENSLNSTVSYYLKGEVVCALLDLELRRRTGGRVTLDDVVRHLYWRYGAKGVPLPEQAFPSVFTELAGVPLDDCYERWIKGTERIQANEVLAYAGVELVRSAKRDSPTASLGVRLKLEAGRAIVDAVPRGGAAHRAGVDVRDEIVAVADRRVAEGRSDLPLAGLQPGARVGLLIARDGRMLTLEAVLDAPLLPDAKIVARADASDEARALYQAWLGDPFDDLKKAPEPAA